MPIKNKLIFRMIFVCLCSCVLLACTKNKPESIEEIPGMTDGAGVHFVVGQIFSDRMKKSLYGPELIVIAGANFSQGALRTDKQAQENEKPAHQVQLSKLFAISRTEITVAQFREFIDNSGYKTQAEINGSGNIFDLGSGKFVGKEGVNWRHNHIGELAAEDFPVVHVSFEDAKAYTQWLSTRTSKSYRLPTESEWEFTFRSGTESIFPWGKKFEDVRQGNLSGALDKMPNNRKWGNAIQNYADGNWGLAPVRQYAAEGLGTFDLLGNASEWVEDCWHDNYRRAPGNGDAWVNQGCTQRVIRGSSWLSAPDQSRSSFRTSSKSTTSNAITGFRVVREL